MKLANLVFEIVKDAIEIPDSSITLENFIEGKFDGDRDFSSQISYAFKYLNTAFSRLRSLNKTLLKVVEKSPDSTGYIEFKEGEVIAVVDRQGPNYKRISFYPFADGIAVKPGIKPFNQLFFVEYRPAIPHFDLSDIREYDGIDERGETVYKEKVVKLEDYGLNEEMCEFAKEYAVAGLLKYLSPDLSSQGIQIAENHISALKTRITNYPQREIEDNFGSGGAW